ncbi:unnamed protein product [Arabis nemorensis]|uniref:Glutathione hydrolase n=1 Tax=Arabis nemorensis TaxID=586526 RepID=A0A565C7Z9_9BRAS|nr:unnamed protein product [Arabis nemorensis]
MSLVRTATIALLLLAFLQIVAAQKREQSIVKYRGAVATDDGRCSVIGMSVLREGGNAIDASVAAALCLGVVSPASSGIGGGAFTVVKIAGGKAIAYDSRETAPLKATENMYGGNADLKKKGALSVGVPGEVAGLFTAWKQHGKLPWKRLVRPAAKLAAGFRISKYLYMQMNTTRGDILADKGLSDLFVTNGELKKAGTIIRNTKLALTLKQIARYGPKAFYNGTVGINLAKDIRKFGGIITLKDLQSYRVKVKKPLSADILGYRLLGMPPPSSGGAAMMLVLNILSQYEIPSGVSGPLGVHRLIEALKHAFAVRMNLGDPDFVAEVPKVVSDMLSLKLAQDLKRKINDDKTFDPKFYGGKWSQIDDHGTSHLSIIDQERNAVSMTSTINGYFGAVMLSPSTGIVLNNEMDDFSIPMKSNGNLNVPPPAPANFIRPGKRPLSSMSPTIVLKDGKVKAAVGASGGANIIAGTTEVFMNHFFLKMDPLSSVLAPRIYHQLIPNRVTYENWTTVFNDHFEIPKETRVVLEKKGHVLTPIAGGTIAQFIVQESGGHSGEMSKLVAVSDPRKGGFPSGY